MGRLSAFRGILIQQQLSSQFANGPLWISVWKEVSYPVELGKVGESQIFGPDILREAEEKVHKVREHLKTAQPRQKSYADKRRQDLTFNVGILCT